METHPYYYLLARSLNLVVLVFLARSPPSIALILASHRGCDITARARRPISSTASALQKTALMVQLRGEITDNLICSPTLTQLSCFALGSRWPTADCIAYCMPT
jgi:hypothetical protein